MGGWLRVERREVKEWGLNAFCVVASFVSLISGMPGGKVRGGGIGADKTFNTRTHTHNTTFRLELFNLLALSVK
jgi:hypothetical protein